MASLPSSIARRGVVATIIALLTVPLLTSTASAAEFSDVPPGHKFYTEVTWAVQKGITNGLSDGTFRPSSTVTRAAFAAFLYRLAGYPDFDLPSKSPYRDVSTSDTFYRHIMWLNETGISTGWADGTFRPEDEINRDVMSVFLYRYSGSPAFTPPSKSPFKDMTPSSRFYKEVTWMNEVGYSRGYSDGTFRPRDDVTRGATVVFLHRISGSPDVDIHTDPPKSFTISGAGYGHGVGMSQYGAQAMALEDYSASDILQYYYSGTSVSTVDANDYIRVEVFGSGDDDRNKVDLIARGDWRLQFYNEGTATPFATWTGSSGERLHITRDGTSVKVTRNGDVSLTSPDRVLLQWEGTERYDSGSSVDAYVDLYRPDSATRVTHGTYRHGQLRISVPSNSSPRLIVSNELRLNTEYLYGIAEMPSSWEPAALQAQAIVARGYAVRADESYRVTCDCNIYDDTRDQNFTGWRKESEGSNAYYGKRWVAAVDATDGKVLTYGGSIAQTYYFSSSGGQTENSEDIWFAALPYLRSVDDPWSEKSINPNRSWTMTLSQSDARSKFGLPDVVSISVTSRTGGGSDAAARVVTAVSSSGEKSTITGPESIRSKLVGGKSPWIWSFTPNY